MFAAKVWAFVFFMGLILNIVMLLNPFTCLLEIILLIWCYFDKTASRGGYHSGVYKMLSDKFRKLAIWNEFKQHFPSKLIVKGQLNKNDKYLLSYHPHGIIGLGVFTNFVYDYPHLQELPVIRPATLNFNLTLPFLRHLALLNRFISCDYDSMKGVLNGDHLQVEDPKESVLLVTGGGYEAEFTKSKTLTVAINKRNGFIRLCMDTGAKLVPVIAFGEADTFYIHTQETIQVTWYSTMAFQLLTRIQKLCRKYCGFSLLFFTGDPIINYFPFPFNFPITPRQTPLTVVIGEPISVLSTKHPTPQQIESVKEEFKRQVRALVVEYGTPYGISKVDFK